MQTQTCSDFMRTVREIDKSEIGGEELFRHANGCQACWSRFAGPEIQAKEQADRELEELRDRQLKKLPLPVNFERAMRARALNIKARGRLYLM